MASFSLKTESIKSSGELNHVENLILRLCYKIASVNNLNEKLTEEFVNKSFAYMVKLFCSDAYSPVYDTLEVSQKIKKKRTS